MTKRGRHGDGSIYQPKFPGETNPPADRNWYVTWYDKDGVKQRATKREDGSKFLTEREAQDYLKLKLADAIRGIAPTNGKSLHYSDLRDLLFKHHRKNSSKSVRALSNGEESIKGLTELDVYGGFRDKNEDGTYTLTGTSGRKVSTITGDDWFENFIVRRYKEGVSKKTIAASAKALRHALRLAKLETVASDIFVPGDASREDCLYIEDFRRLIGEDGPALIDKDFHPVLKFLFYQGARIIETLGITWNQIDLTSGEYRPHATSNKTGDTSAKPLNPTEVTPILRKLKGNAKETDYVFQAARSGGKNLAKRVEKAFRKAMLEMKPVGGLGKNKGPAGNAWNCAQCQIIDRTLPAPKEGDTFAHVCTNKQSTVCQKYRVPMQWSYCGPSPHALRASCAVYYLEKGMNETEVMKVTGHSDLKVFRGYARLKLENIAQKMGAATKKNRAA
jgi:site-specific recombinase XerC